MGIDLTKVALGKTLRLRRLIHDAVRIIESVGVPVEDLTARRLERMGMCFLALCKMTPTSKWHEAASMRDQWILKSRDIIDFMNEHFKESISSGSYDDIRRKDLIRLVGMGLVVKSANNPDSDNNDGTRGNAIEDSFADLIRQYGSKSWNVALNSFEIDQDYIDKFNGKREVSKLPVQVADGVTIYLDDGPHNRIQKAVIDEFLPNFGHGATVLYVGDTTEKLLHKYSDRMAELGLDIEDRKMLPDIIAFSEKENWLYLVEAVHSSNPLNPDRCIELQRRFLAGCNCGVVFVSAFLSKKDFGKWYSKIAWETEVWIADAPEHLIHFNGDKFIGPHLNNPHH